MSRKLRISIWIIAALILLTNFIALIIALTDILPESPLKEYKIIIGILFTTIGGFMRQAYSRQKANLE